MNLWFIKLYQISSKNKVSIFRLIYKFLGKRWYLNLVYNRYLASISFSLGYNYTFVLLDKGFFEAPTLLSSRYISDISKILSNRFYRYFYLGELLLYLFLIYAFFYLSFFFNVDFLFEILFPSIFSFIEKSFFTLFFFAVPRKKRTKKTFFYNKIIKKFSLRAVYINSILIKIIK